MKLAWILAAVVSCVACREDRAAVDTSRHVYRATGVVRSFGPAHAYVNIAHDDIPGYMAAMTMSFEPRTPKQLEGLSIDDEVRFAFEEDKDARRLLDTIEKR